MPELQSDEPEMESPASVYLNNPLDGPPETAGLADKVRPEEWIDQYLSRPLATARRVLDVGCGSAAILSAMARAYPAVEAVGVDVNREQLAQASRAVAGLGNAWVGGGNATALPFADNSFDLVYCRFLLESLKDRNRAIKEAARVCKPGGTVLLQDLDGHLLWHYPMDQRLQSGINLALDHLTAAGFDPFVGRKLYSLAYAAGLIDIHVQAESYHLFAGKIDAENLRRWELKLDHALAAASKALGKAAAGRVKSRFLEYLLREDTMTYSMVFTVAGTKSTKTPFFV